MENAEHAVTSVPLTNDNLVFFLFPGIHVKCCWSRRKTGVKCLLSSPVIKTAPLKIVLVFNLKICGCDLLFGGFVFYLHYLIAVINSAVQPVNLQMWSGEHVSHCIAIVGSEVKQTATKENNRTDTKDNKSAFGERIT